VKTIYLNNNATTKVDKAVLEEMRLFYAEVYSNLGVPRLFNAQVQQKVSEARERVAALLGALPEEIIFYASGTESSYAAIYAAIEMFPEKRHIITSKVEHRGMLSIFHDLEKKGYKITEIGVDYDGCLDIEAYIQAIDNDTVIVSLMWANNETGVIFPVEEAAAIAKDKGVLFHTDAVQAVGKIPVCMAKSQIDMLSLSGHKIYAPMGVGALYMRGETVFLPYIKDQYQEKNGNTCLDNIALSIALGKACELAGQYIDIENGYVKSLRNQLQKELMLKIPLVRVNGGRAARLPNTLSIAFDCVETNAILKCLSEVSIYASSGILCTGDHVCVSHVLQAMNVPSSCIQGVVHFSLCRKTTIEDIQTVACEMPPIITKLRSILAVAGS